MNAHRFVCSSGSEEEIEEVQVTHNETALEALISLPPQPRGIVVFAHWETGELYRPRNHYVVECLAMNGLGVLQLAMLTEAERTENELSGCFRNDLGHLAGRLVAAADSVRQHRDLRLLPLGFLGFGQGGTGALMAAASLTAAIEAVVVADGRPDLLGSRLGDISAATLLVVNEDFDLQRCANEVGFTRLPGARRLEILSGVASLATGIGLEEVISLATEWFNGHLGRKPSTTVHSETNSPK